MIYTDEMLDAARGVMQLLRGKPGVTFSELRKHCIARGDDMRRWPDWALAEEGYVTEASATMLVYEIIDRFAPPEAGEIHRLRKAIMDANTWLRAGEGVGLTYYHENYGEDDSVAVIEAVVSHSPLPQRREE